MITLADLLYEMFTVPSVIFVVGGIIAVVAIIFSTITSAWAKVSAARAREESRREIAAYVAEGSIDAAKAIAMLNAGVPDEDAVVKVKR
jgi:hypothetical protein